MAFDLFGALDKLITSFNDSKFGKLVKKGVEDGTFASALDWLDKQKLSEEEKLMYQVQLKELELELAKQSVEEKKVLLDQIKAKTNSGLAGIFSDSKTWMYLGAGVVALLVIILLFKKKR